MPRFVRPYTKSHVCYLLISKLEKVQYQIQKTCQNIYNKKHRQNSNGIYIGQRIYYKMLNKHKHRPLTLITSNFEKTILYAVFFCFLGFSINVFILHKIQHLLFTRKVPFSKVQHQHTMETLCVFIFQRQTCGNVFLTMNVWTFSYSTGKGDCILLRLYIYILFREKHPLLFCSISQILLNWFESNLPQL